MIVRKPPCGPGLDVYKLLDEAVAEIGIDKPALGSADSLAQRLIAYPLPALEPAERLRTEHPRSHAYPHRDT
jgi:hypothetical protein